MPKSSGNSVEHRASDRLDISIAVPIYNEESVLAEFIRRLQAALDLLDVRSAEIVFVNDGSTDATPELLDEAAAKDPRMVAIHLSRNFGHQAAITAALDQVRGVCVVVMDADLQDAPEAIPQMFAKFQEGYDVVYVIRDGREGVGILNLFYILFYRLFTVLSEVKMPMDAGDFALLSGRVVNVLRSFPEHNRYLRGLRAWAGFRQIGIRVKRDRRFAGRSKYSASRLVKLAIDGILAFSTVPLRLASLLGLGGMTVAAGYALYALVVWFGLGGSPRGFTAVVFLIVFLSGVQFFWLGVIGEYLGRVYDETKRRPLYLIERICGDRHES